MGCRRREPQRHHAVRPHHCRDRTTRPPSRHRDLAPRPRILGRPRRPVSRRCGHHRPGAAPQTQTRPRRPRRTGPSAAGAALARRANQLMAGSQLRCSCDETPTENPSHRLAQLALAVTLIIAIKLIDHRNRWQPHTPPTSANALSLNPPIGCWWAWGSRVGGGLGWRRVVGGVVWCVWACWARGGGCGLGLSTLGLCGGVSSGRRRVSRRVRAEP